MKNQLVLILAVLGISFGAQAKSVSDYSGLSSVMEALEYHASNGASLALFEYSESFFHRDLKSCSVVTAEKAVDLALDKMEELFTYSEPDLEYLVEEEGRLDMEKLFGKGDYYVCHKSEYVFMGYLEKTRFIKKDFSYRLELAAGYED